MALDTSVGLLAALVSFAYEDLLLCMVSESESLFLRWPSAGWDDLNSNILLIPMIAGDYTLFGMEN